jgi:hypothetical protein
MTLANTASLIGCFEACDTIAALFAVAEMDIWQPITSASHDFKLDLLPLIL